MLRYADSEIIYLYLKFSETEGNTQIEDVSMLDTVHELQNLVRFIV